MKDELSALELSYLESEFKVLCGGRLDKIFRDEKSFLFVFHVTSKGKMLFKVVFPGAAYLSEYKDAVFGEPTGFCAFLRKHFSGKTLESIEQKDFERILLLRFKGNDSSATMIIELFKGGNLIVCDENQKIISAMETHTWKDRTIRGGIAYEYPPKQTNPKSIPKNEFSTLIKESKRDSIVKTLAVDFSLGGLYAEEVCALGEIDKTKKRLSEIEADIIYSCVKKIFSKKIKANIVENEALPFELELFKDKKKKFFSSFSGAIDEQFSKRIIAFQSQELVSRKQKSVEKIKSVIAQQEQMIQELSISSDENQRKGELIYENYGSIKKILDDISAARKNFSWEDIKARVKDHKVIKELNEKEGKIIIEP